MELRKLLKDKRGQLGLGTVRDVMIAFLVISVIAVAIILALVSLRDSGIFKAGSEELNDTSELIGNVTEGTKDFFNNTGTIFAILVVVVIILAISIIIGVVSRFGGAGTTRSL